MTRLPPHANMAAKKADISISCNRVKRCGMEMGSSAIKSGPLKASTLSSRNFFKSCMCLSYSAVQVLDQVIHVLYSYAEADQGIHQAVFHALFPGNGGMGHGSGVSDQGFHSSQGFG